MAEDGTSTKRAQCSGIYADSDDVYMLVQTDEFMTGGTQGWALVIKDIVNYSEDYFRYVKFGATTLNTASFQVTEEGCDTDNLYRFFIAGTSDFLNDGGYNTGVTTDLTNFIAKFSIFQGGKTSISGETAIQSEHYGYDLYADDDKAAQGQFVILEFENEGWN